MLIFKLYNKMSGKYKLAICNLFNHDVHGYDNYSSPDIHSHHLVYTIIDPEEFYNNEYTVLIKHIRSGYMRWITFMNQQQTNISHPTIRNYYNIINKKKTYKIDIIEEDTLEGDECVAYIKTFWIKIIQRRWRKVYNERKKILKIRKSVVYQREKQMTGKWPKDARIWPRFNLGLKCGVV
jgi:hypothetical protein